MRLESKNPNPKIQREKPHRKQCVWTGTFGVGLPCTQTFHIDEISDHEGWQRPNREEKQPVEIEHKVRDVVAPRFCSVQLGALPRRSREDVVFNDVPWNDGGLPVCDGIDPDDWNLNSAKEVSGAKLRRLNEPNEYQGCYRHRSREAHPSADHPFRLVNGRNYVPGVEKEFFHHKRKRER